MFTYQLVESTDEYLKYEYYPWNKKEDAGYIKLTRDGKLLEKKLSSIDSGYPMYFNEFQGEIFGLLNEGKLTESSSKCWL